MPTQYLSEIVKEATCLEEGTVVYTCECGNSYEEKLDKPGHVYVEITVEGTCPEGAVITFECENCGETIIETMMKTDCIFEVVEQINATCTEAGSVKSACAVCEAEKAEPIPAKGHNEIEEVVKDVTLFSAGSKHTICTECGEELSVTEIPAKIPVGVVGIVICVIIGSICGTWVYKKKK